MTEHDDRWAVPPTAAIPADAPMFDRAAWIRVLPFTAYLYFIVIGDVLERLGVRHDTLRWLYPAKIALVALLLALFWRLYRELSRVRLAALSALTALGTGAVVLVFWISLDTAGMAVGSPSGFDPRVDGRIHWLLAAIRIAGAALVVPVMEELFWRSFLMRWVDALISNPLSFLNSVPKALSSPSCCLASNIASGLPGSSRAWRTACCTCVTATCGRRSWHMP